MESNIVFAAIGVIFLLVLLGVLLFVALPMAFYRKVKTTNNLTPDQQRAADNYSVMKDISRYGRTPQHIEDFIDKNHQGS